MSLPPKQTRTTSQYLQAICGLVKKGKEEKCPTLSEVRTLHVCQYASSSFCDVKSPAASMLLAA